MRPGTTHVVTKGSHVWLDDAAGEYLRLPKTEGPRERAEWSDERAGPLQDAVWHPMVAWRIGPHPAAAQRPQDRRFPRPDGLMIDYLDPNGTPRTAWFPQAQLAIEVDQ